MSTVTKGRAAELRAQRLLEAAGWTVHRAVRSRFHGNDVFKCDLVAKKREHPTWWVQVTHATVSVSVKVRDLEALPWGPGDVVDIWRWHTLERAYQVHRRAPHGAFVGVGDQDGAGPLREALEPEI